MAHQCAHSHCFSRIHCLRKASIWSCGTFDCHQCLHYSGLGRALHPLCTAPIRCGVTLLPDVFSCLLVHVPVGPSLAPAQAEEFSFGAAPAVICADHSFRYLWHCLPWKDAWPGILSRGAHFLCDHGFHHKAASWILLGWCMLAVWEFFDAPSTQVSTAGNMQV